MAKVVEIASANSSSKLVFSDFDRNGFVVSLQNPNIRCQVRVRETDEISPPYYNFFVDLFKTMVDRWKGWDDELAWESLEGEFAVVATADSTGHVILGIKFRNFDGPEPWSTEIEFTLETMQVEKAHRQLVSFFS